MQSLAVDHLSLISAFLDSHDISKLYACGDTKLSRTLELAVNHLEFKLRRLTQLYWPSIISQFSRLLSLVISLPSVSNLVITGVDLFSLPPTLEKLALDYPDGFRSLMEDVGPVPKNTRPPLKFGKIRHLATCVPNLKHLEWHNSAFLSSNEGQNDFLSSLPPRLEWLSLSELCCLDASCLSHLPSTLQYLRISLLEVVNEEIFAWPDSLTYLKLDTQDSVLPLRYIENMPTTLVELKLKVSFENGDALKMLPQSLLRLSLELPVFSAHEASILPPNLLHLKVSASEYSSDAIKCLPRTLTSYDDTCFALSSNPLEMPSIHCLGDFPPNMQEMPQWVHSDAAKDSWHRLPRALRQTKRKVELHGYAISDPDIVLSLPPKLADFVLYGPTQPLLQNLPMNVTSLILGDSLQIVVEPAWLNHLTCLTSLDIRQGVSVNYAGFAQFTPRGLKELRLQKIFCFENLDLSLPCFQGLHTLSVRATRQFFQQLVVNPKTNEELAQWEAETEAASKFIKSFPKSIHTLEYTQRASGSLIQLLPTSITSLAFYLFLNCPLSQVFSALPPNIANLRFPTHVINEDFALSEDVLNNIPHSLHTLAIQSSPGITKALQPLTISRPWIYVQDYA